MFLRKVSPFSVYAQILLFSSALVTAPSGISASLNIKLSSESSFVKATIMGRSRLTPCDSYFGLSSEMAIRFSQSGIKRKALVSFVIFTFVLFLPASSKTTPSEIGALVSGFSFETAIHFIKL